MSSYNSPSVETLAGMFPGTIAIVGKGPSLLALRSEHLEDLSAVITLNHAILKVRVTEHRATTLMMWKDAPAYLKDMPVMCPPNSLGCLHQIIEPVEPEILLLHEYESGNCLPAYSQRYIFNNPRFGLNWYQESVFSAICIARMLGASRLRLISFDAATNGDCRNTMDGVSISGKENYLHQRDGINRVLRKLCLPATWVTPHPASTTPALKGEA